MCNKFRPLTADEVECRVAQAGKSNNGAWASILIYKDARVDQKLLDEVIGPMNWKNDYEIIDGNLYCTVSIWDKDKNEWISKQNVGTESNTEKEKGQASDAFKRACFNWGIGRELYTSPKIFINLESGEYDEANGKLRCKANFYVSEMHVSEDRIIDRLVIVDKNNRERFRFAGQTSPAPAPAGKTKKTATKKADGIMTLEQFRERWESGDDGITWDDIAACAKAWGLISNQKEMQFGDVKTMVLKAAGCKTGSPVTLESVVKQAQEASDSKMLVAVWNAYKAQFGNEPEFVNAIRRNPNNPKK